MNANELKEVLELHKKWLNNDESGKRADLCNADLCNAVLRDAVLRDAVLKGAVLRGADLSDADLKGAVLKGADLKGADLRGADLKGADLDYSCLPLWCFSLTAQMDDRQVIQLLYHTLSIARNSKNVSEELKSVLLTKTNLEIANRFHRVEECGVLKGVKE